MSCGLLQAAFPAEKAVRARCKNTKQQRERHRIGPLRRQFPDGDRLRKAKRQGFSDIQLSRVLFVTIDVVGV